MSKKVTALTPPASDRAAEVAHALIHMAAQYEGYDERKRRYTVTLKDFAREVRAQRLVQEANERREDDAARDAELAAVRAEASADCAKYHAAAIVEAKAEQLAASIALLRQHAFGKDALAHAADFLEQRAPK
jgi:hypothetical protein